MRGSGPKAASEHKIYRMGVLFPWAAAAYLGPIETRSRPCRTSDAVTNEAMPITAG